MQVKEFKAWLEGFKSVVKGPPTEAQWREISRRIDEIETSTGWHTAVERPVPKHSVYADSYIHHYGLGLGEHNK